MKEPKKPEKEKLKKQPLGQRPMTPRLWEINRNRPVWWTRPMAVDGV
jgi:hypothetical protein